MKTAIVKIRDPRSGRAALKRAAEILRAGRLVAFPTETVYGLGANALDGGAVAGIFRAKGRPQDNPLIAHIARMEELEPLVAEVSPAAENLAGRFWPGPLTMVLPKSGILPDEVSAGLPTVAVRMPSHPVAGALISLAGIPVAAPSANRSGSPSPTTADHCAADLDGRVDIILDGGPCPVGLESTVVDLAGDRPRLLRPGAVTPEQLREALGDLVIDAAVLHKMEGSARAASPGMKYQHYAPRAEVTLVHGGREAFLRLLEQEAAEGVCALAFDEDRGGAATPVVAYGPEADPAAQAERLFSALRELDEAGALRVYARAPKADGLGLAVYNRLIRAAGFREIHLDGPP